MQVCARLLAEGFDVNERCGGESVTPSHVAAAHDEVDVLAFLLGTSRKRERGGRREPDSIGPRSWNSVQADSVHPGMEQRLPFQGVQLGS